MEDNPGIDALMQTIDGFRKPDILDNYLRPNTQFIQRATQLSRMAKELVGLFERLRDELAIIKIRSASARTGSGFLINTDNYILKEINQDNIVEVIDFDPVRNNMMVIGNYTPASDAALHWFIYRGLPEVNSIINIADDELIEKFDTISKSQINNKDQILHLKLALEILKNVKDSEITLLHTRSINGIIITGNTLTVAYDLFENSLKKVSKPKQKKKS